MLSQARHSLSGLLRLLIDVSMLVMLQALKDEPPLGAKCKDKFLIQSTIISSDKNHLSLTDLVSCLWSGASSFAAHPMVLVGIP